MRSSTTPVLDKRVFLCVSIEEFSFSYLDWISPPDPKIFEQRRDHLLRRLLQAPVQHQHPRLEAGK